MKEILTFAVHQHNAETGAAFGPVSATFRVYSSGSAADFPLDSANARGSSHALKALTETLEFLKEDLKKSNGGELNYILTNERYLFDGLYKWMPTWVKNGWVTKNGTPVKQRQLWERLKAVTRECNLLLTHHLEADTGYQEFHQTLEITRRRVPSPSSDGKITRSFADESLNIALNEPKAPLMPIAPKPAAFLPGQGVW